MRATTYRGLITPGDLEIVIQPKYVPASPKYGIMYTHGAGGTADALIEYAKATHRTRMAADAGFTAVSSDWGGPQTWGNQVAMNALTAGYNFLQTQPGVKPGKVIIAGGSMGGLNALNWASRNPTKVACVSIYIPVIDMAGIHDNNLSGYASYVDAAHGGNWDTATMAYTWNPLHQAEIGKYAGLPIRLHYGTTDPLCLPERALEFAQLVGSNVQLRPLYGGHDESGEIQVDRVAEVEFFKEHGS